MSDFTAARGRKVTEVFIGEETLLLRTDRGPLRFVVWGDCCSHSYFHDLVGVEKLLANGPIVKIESIPLSSELQHNESCGPDDGCTDKNHGECVQVYGYGIVTEHPMWGEQTTVVAFRNDSNGYYGGWMNLHATDQTSDESTGLTLVTHSWDADDATPSTR